MLTTSVPLTLADFLETSYLEDSPAWEYVEGKVYQKPMPKTHYLRLQLKLAAAINLVAEDAEVAAAFPELRCTFEGRSIVPDIAVFRWEQIPLTATGELFSGAMSQPPDWTIEILSPGQSSTKVMDNILFCMEQGTALGWLVDPSDRGIFVFRPNQALRLYRADEVIPVLAGIELELSANRIFRWLQMG